MTRPAYPRIVAGGGASASGGAPSGSAGGDLTGTYPNPTIGSAKVVAAAMAAGAVDLSTSVATGILAAGRFPALTGDVTTSAGALAATIPAGTVTLAKQANLAASSIIGNNTGAPAAPLALTTAQVMALLSAGAAAAFDLNGQRITTIADATAAGDAWTYGNAHRSMVSTAVDRGWLAQNYDIEVAANSGSALATAGTIYVAKVWAPAGTITNVILYLTAQGSSLTTGQCFVAIYDASKNQQGSTSSDQAATGFVNPVGVKTIGIGSWVNATPQYAYVAMMFNGSTGPALLRATNGSNVNAGLAAAASNHATDSQTSRTTTMPSSLATFTASNVGYWVALA